MNDLVVIERKGLNILPSYDGMGGEGDYTVVTKCRAGFPVVTILKGTSAYNVFKRYTTDDIINISFNGDFGFQFTMYARVGKKVWISEQIARELKVGDINDGGVMSKTALYSMEQYNSVNARTWGDNVFVMNSAGEDIV